MAKAKKKSSRRKGAAPKGSRRAGAGRRGPTPRRGNTQPRRSKVSKVAKRGRLSAQKGRDRVGSTGSSALSRVSQRMRASARHGGQTPKPGAPYWTPPRSGPSRADEIMRQRRGAPPPDEKLSQRAGWPAWFEPGTVYKGPIEGLKIRNAFEVEARRVASEIRKSHDPVMQRQRQHIAELLLTAPDSEDLEGNELGSYLEDLMNLLTGMAPDGYYFGQRDGDDTDFGYWLAGTSSVAAVGAKKKREPRNLARFEYWWQQQGHWVYPDREKAFDKWLRDGIVGLPDAQF